MPSSKRRSLAVIIGAWMVTAFVVAMATCVLIEYVRTVDVAPRDLLTHHIAELLLYGGLLCGLSWIVLRVVVIRPIDEIFRHLYRIGGGDHSPVAVKTNVQEIQSVVDAINVMLWRMQQQADRQALDHVREKAASIRQTIGACANLAPSECTAVLAHLADLEATLRRVGLAARIRDVRRLEPSEQTSAGLVPPDRKEMQG